MLLRSLNGEQVWLLQMKSEEGDVVVRRRLAACCWGEGRPATCMVMLDDQGSLVDVLFLPSFSGQLRSVRQAMGTYNIAEDPRKVRSIPTLPFSTENPIS